MDLQLTHPRNTLVQTLKTLYDCGMTTTSGGNISIKDDDGNIWITPGGIDKACLRPEDIVRVAPDGTVHGLHKPSSELPFHKSIYQLRNDIKAILHAHSPALVAFSLTRQMPDPALIPGAARICGKVAFAKYAIPGSEALGSIIAQEFAKGNNSVIMENHGAVVAGKSITETFARFETLDYVARIQINAASLGGNIQHLADETPQFSYPEFIPDAASANEGELRETIAKFHARAYRRQLLFSSSAFLAARLENDDDFLITPSNIVPRQLEACDIVRMRNGMCQAAKEPSTATPVCRNIFNQCPWVNSIVMMRPPYAMAFAVTGNKIDTRIIPESYIMMRDVPVVSSKEYFNDPDAVVKVLSPANPVVLIENCGVLTVGKTILEAFDRLEVSELTAQSIIMASCLGELSPINEQQIADIVAALKLPVK